MESRLISGFTIVHVVTRLDHGGAARVILDLVRMLSQDGMRVILIVGKTENPQTDLHAFCRQFGIELYMVQEIVREVSPVNDFVAFWRIREIIKETKPDIVHTHTSKAGIVGRFAAWSAGVKHIVHSPRGHIFYGYYNRVVTYFFILLERFAARITEKITTLTEKGMKDHIQKRIGTESKFTVIHSGVNIDLFKNGNGNAVRNETGFMNNRIVGWAGRLDPVKNCLLFIESASIIYRKMPDARFIVAGDGEEREMLQKRMESSGLSDCMKFLGNRDDMPDVMSAFDVFVLTSRNEGFGRVLVEAMASGAVPVSTRVGGTVDVIEDGVSGFLVVSGTPQSVADAVCSLLYDDELYCRLRESGKKRAELFTLNSMVKKYENLYTEILEV